MSSNGAGHSSQLTRQIACSTLTFGKLSNEEEFDRATHMMHDVGYRGVQLEYRFLPPDLKRSPERARELLKENGLELVAVAIDDEESANFAAEIKSPVATLCLFQRSMSEAISKTRRLNEICFPAGVQIALHPHVQSNILQLSSAEEIMKSTGVPGLCFDTAHFAALGISYDESIRKMEDKILIVHLKDLLHLTLDEDPSKDFVDFGEGVVDFRLAIDLLKKQNYHGWFVVEVDSPHGSRAEDSIKNNFVKAETLLADGHVSL